MEKEIALIVSIITSIVYILSVTIKFGIPKSVSMSYYDIKNRNRWIFQLYIYVTCFCIMIFMQNIYYYTASLILSIVGLTPTIMERKRKWIPILHKSLAIISFIIYSVSPFLITKKPLFIYIYISAILLIATIYLIGRIKKKNVNIIYWSEIILFLCLYISASIIITN